MFPADVERYMHSQPEPGLGRLPICPDHRPHVAEGHRTPEPRVRLRRLGGEGQVVDPRAVLIVEDLGTARMHGTAGVRPIRPDDAPVASDRHGTAEIGLRLWGTGMSV